MREITILSGKGGTGKTSLTAAFASVADHPVVCDLDVDAPDLHLLLRPQVIQTHPFVAGREASIDPETCTACGICRDRCRFDAIRGDAAGFTVVEPLCEGCGVCAHVCPAGAARLSAKTSGRRYRSRTAVGPMLHAELFPGAENSGLLVSTLRREAAEIAFRGGHPLVISDGPPGIGCPVISSLTGTTLAVLITEPTPSGRHDLERIADLCRHFGRPAAVIINKADLDAAATAEIERFCLERNHPVVARLPFNPLVVDALVRGQTMAGITTNGIADIVRGAWKTIEATADLLPETISLS